MSDREEIAALRERVSELEDTIRLWIAEGYIATSYGRDTDSVEAAERVYARRGKDWQGASVDLRAPR